MIRDWRLIRSAAPLESTLPAMQAPMRVTGKRSPGYLMSLRKLMRKAINGARDFVASWRLRAGGARGPDLIPHFRDSGRANFVEHSNHVPVHRHQAGAEGDLDLRICLVKLIKAREHLIIGHILIVEVDRVSLLYLDGNVILYGAWGRSNCSWQIDPNPFHMGLAKTHHHKTGEQKEHDIDQGNDLDTRSLVRNRRRDSHMLNSKNDFQY